MMAQGISEDEIKPNHKDCSENKEIPRTSIDRKNDTLPTHKNPVSVAYIKEFPKDFFVGPRFAQNG